MSLRNLAGLVALASAISLVERFLPGPLPWLKPGLANLITLVLVAKGFYREGFLVAIFRTFVAALAWGGLFSPSHLFSLTGGLAAIGLMILAARFLGPWISLIGLSVLGALGHGLGQLLLGRVLFFGKEALGGLLPLVILTSVLSGLVVGIFGRKAVARKWFTFEDLA